MSVEEDALNLLEILIEKKLEYGDGVPIPFYEIVQEFSERVKDEDDEEN